MQRTFWSGPAQKYCHAELVSASTLDIVHRFRNEFGMTLRNELLVIPVSGGKCGGKTSDGNREYHLPAVSRCGVPVFQKSYCFFRKISGSTTSARRRAMYGLFIV